jgi:hypothetical protein
VRPATVRGNERAASYKASRRNGARHRGENDQPRSSHYKASGGSAKPVAVGIVRRVTRPAQKLTGRQRAELKRAWKRRENAKLALDDALLDLGKLASEYGIAAVAREFDLSHESVRQWVKAWEERSK